MSNSNGSDFVVLDNSHLSVLKACGTMARYTYLDKRVRAGTAIARDAGKALHSALELRYRTEGGKAPNGTTQYAMGYALEMAYQDIQLAEDDYLTLHRMKTVIDSYNNGCRFEMGVGGKNGIYEFGGYRDEVFDVLGVEFRGAVELGTVNGVRVIYVVRSDLLTRWHERGEFMVIDHKTSNRFHASTPVQYAMSAQAKGYCACIPQYLREGIGHLPDEVQAQLASQEAERERLAAMVKRVDGFTLNAIVIGKEPESLARVKVPPLQFIRHSFYYTDAQLEEWRKDALLWAKLWIEAKTSGQFTMNTSHCHQFFGRTCGFYETCSLPPEQRHLMLASDIYRDNDFEPLKEAAQLNETSE